MSHSSSVREIASSPARRWSFRRKWVVAIAALVALGLVLQIAMTIAVLRSGARTTAFEWLRNIAAHGVQYMGEQTGTAMRERGADLVADPRVAEALARSDGPRLAAAIEHAALEKPVGDAWLARLPDGSIVGGLSCPDAYSGVAPGVLTAKMCGDVPVLLAAVDGVAPDTWLAVVCPIDDEYLSALETIAGAHAGVVGPDGLIRTTMRDDEGRALRPTVDLGPVKSDGELLGISFGKVHMTMNGVYDGYRLGSEPLAIGLREMDAYVMAAPFFAGDQGSAVRLVLVIPAVVTEIGAYYVSIAIAVAGLVLLVLLVLLAMRLVRSLTRPLRALTDAVVAVRLEDLTAHVPDGGSDEVGDLGKAFNAMLARIADSRARVVQTEKMAAIGQLAGGVAHEINNPLAVILGFAQAVERRISADDPMRMPIASIVRESLRCKALVHELLLFSRTAKTHAEPVAIHDIFESARLLLATRSKTEDIDLVVDVEHALPPLLGNRTQLQQVLVNLGTNALDAVGRGGRVVMRAYDDDDGTRIEVSDSGPGIPPGVRQRIFEPFFTTKEPGRGTGLGLSMVFEIVQQHGGTIDVESEVGRGTTFLVRIPDAQPEDRTANAA